MLTQEFWDTRYASAPQIWSGRVNPVLAALVAGLPPGRALDVGCGEGGDTVWLARQGWQVLGVDLSPVALARAADAATAAGVAGSISWQQADARAWSPTESYDLVTTQFVHLPAADLAALHRRLAAAVVPGGTLLIVNHHPVDNETLRRPRLPEWFTVAEDMAGVLDPDAWEIEVSAPTRPFVHPEDGRSMMITDTVLRAVRRA